MDLFDQMGAWVSERFQRADHEEASLAEIALKAFDKFKPAKHLDRLEVIRWLLRARVLPEQFDPRGAYYNYLFPSIARTNAFKDSLVLSQTDVLSYLDDRTPHTQD